MTENGEMKRVKRILIAREWFPHMLKEGNIVTVTKGIPEGATVVDSGYDPDHQSFYITIEHESFDPIGEVERIPSMSIQFDAGPTKLSISSFD